MEWPSHGDFVLDVEQAVLDYLEAIEIQPTANVEEGQFTSAGGATKDSSPIASK